MKREIINTNYEMRLASHKGMISSKILCSSGLRELQSTTEDELSPTLRFGDASQSALVPSSILDKAFRGEL
jgi:hypothetical protein